MRFCLLHLIIPRFSVFNELQTFSQFYFLKSFITPFFHLIFVGPLVLITMGFELVIFLTNSISSILLRYHHNSTLFFICNNIS